MSIKICILSYCNEVSYCKGLCHLHYKRQIAGVKLDQPKQIKQYGSVSHVCPHCDQTFLSKPSEAPRRIFCSRKCSQSSKKGALNQHWKGGATADNAEQRNRFAREVRDLVFQRDEYTCQICRTAASGNLQADHIKKWADYPELRFELSNCRTLCRPCHYYVTIKRKMPESSLWGLPHLTKDLT